MRFSSVEIRNYRNISSLSLRDISDLLVLYGNNASGKTSFLDALYFLAYSRSFTLAKDQFLVKNGEEAAAVKAIVEKKQKKQEFSCVLSDSEKLFKTEGKKYKRLADHIGAMPIVVISPYDLDIVFGGGADRRKYFDIFISIFDKKYLDCLMQHNKLIKIRNKLLKDGSDFSLLEVYDFKIEQVGTYIYEKRKQFVPMLSDNVKKQYEAVFGSKGEFELIYQSALSKKSYYELLKANYEKDSRYQFTTSGIHRDDVNLMLSGNDLKVFGSQGQQKLIMSLMKVGQCQILAEEFSIKPVLLIDDLSDKLDENVISALCRYIDKAEFLSQIIISDQKPNMATYFTERKHTELKMADGKILQ